MYIIHIIQQKKIFLLFLLLQNKLFDFVVLGTLFIN